MSARTGVLIFEGGQAPAPLGSPQALLARVRQWTTLDTLEKFLSRPEVDVVVVATDSPSLARQAREAGAAVHRTGPGFHFGQTLRTLAERHRLDRVVFLGGGSAPLIRPGEVTGLLEAIGPGGRRFAANNVQSPDLVGLGSTEALAVLSGLETDNATLFALTDAGYERRLLPDTATVGFDLDTPSDILFLAREARRGSPDTALGPRCAEGLGRLDLNLSTLDRAASVLLGDYPAVTLIGRVSGPTIGYLNANLLLRLRVFSEERGMKALGRVEKGEVRSLVGTVLRDLGVDYLVRQLADLSEAVFWDTRVVMAHLWPWPDDSDRFEADLGHWERVRHPGLRELCRATAQAEIPFVLGGHSVVAGGLKLLVQGLLEDRAQPDH